MRTKLWILIDPLRSSAIPIPKKLDIFYGLENLKNMD